MTDQWFIDVYIYASVIISRLTPGCESRSGCILFLSFLGLSLADQF